MLQTPTKRIVLALCLLLAVVLQLAEADSRGDWVQPPGLSYGGIPYGSVSGMVANYFQGTDRGATLPVFGSRSFGGSWNYLQPARNNFID